MSLSDVLTHDHVLALTVLENNSESDVDPLQPGLIGSGVHGRMGNMARSSAMI